MRSKGRIWRIRSCMGILLGDGIGICRVIRRQIRKLIKGTGNLRRQRDCSQNLLLRRWLYVDLFFFFVSCE